MTKIKILTVAEVAALESVTTNTIYGWIKNAEGKKKPYITESFRTGKTVLINSNYKKISK